MKVLVCGGRYYADYDKVTAVLNNCHGQTLHGISLLIEGGASGADALARRWAYEHHVNNKTMPANWKAHGRGAGPIRNREMIKEAPDLVIAFPGGSGTADMVAVAEKAGIEVIKID